MKITVLCENSIALTLGCYHHIWGEHGLSLWIENNWVNILFDTAIAGQYVKNAKTMWIDLQKADFVILSHSHDDHSRGLQFHNFTTKKPIIFHPQVLKELPKDELKKIKKDFTIITSEGPLEFSPGVTYLGEIPHTTNFETGMDKENLIKDDSAMTIETKGGIFIVTGCSHSGICNICEYAKKVTGKKIIGVIWWFHLFHKWHPKAIKGTIEYFKNENIRHLFPMHCIDFETMIAMRKEVPFEKLWTGSVVEIR